MRGIRFRGKHSYYDFGAVLSARRIGYPERNIVEERVPYSNVIYDFSALYGAPTYGDRALEYTFTLIRASRLELQYALDAFAGWLCGGAGRSALHDDACPDTHFTAQCTSISEPAFYGSTAVEITVHFTANPFRMPVTAPLHPYPYPDLNTDGTVDALDAALILDAAAHIGAGEPSGLTPAQEALADVNLDGVIDATDAVIVADFAALTGTGHYENTPEGWVRYMNDRFQTVKGVI